MRLLEVFFVAPINVAPINGPGVYTTHVRASMVPVLEYDADKRVVLVGEDEYPRERVDHWRRARRTEEQVERPQCEVCQRRFNDRRALGAHKMHKHGIKGTSRP